MDLVCFEAKEHVEEHLECARNRKWAELAWEQIHGSSKGTYSEDYAQGFKDGFADFLFEGGSGEPPPLPPRHYRGLAYQTPQGYQAIQDWFAGYRHGTTVARTDGYRQWVTGSTSLPHPQVTVPNAATLGKASPARKVVVETPPIQEVSFEAPVEAQPCATTKPTPTADPALSYYRTQWYRFRGDRQD